MNEPWSFCVLGYVRGMSVVCMYVYVCLYVCMYEVCTLILSSFKALSVT